MKAVKTKKYQEFKYKDIELSPIYSSPMWMERLKVKREKNGKITYDILRETDIVLSDIDMKLLVGQKENYTFHQDYIRYLDLAYKNDYGIVVKPDFIWFTILNELARMVHSDVEGFRDYFTRLKNKIEIKIIDLQATDIKLPVEKVVEALEFLMPSGIKNEHVVPKFSTLNEKSSYAFQCSFLDTVSVYYNYSLYGCGYKKIRVEGKISDYKLMIDTLKKWGEMVPNFMSYIERCILVLEDIIENWTDKNFWKNILRSESGYLQEVYDGWFTRFYHNLKRKSHDIGIYSKKKIVDGYRDSDFVPHLSKVDYEVQGFTHSNGFYTMYSGILSSKVDGDYLVPDFGYMVAPQICEEIKNNQKTL